MVELVRNEQIKLRATLLNTLAAASIVVGALTPIAGAVYRPAELNPYLPGFFLVIFAAGWILFGVALHFLAHRSLKGLRE
jgi:hypothetical protein